MHGRVRNQHIATHRILPVGLRAIREQGGKIHRHITVVDDNHGTVEPGGLDTAAAAPTLRKQGAQFARDGMILQHLQADRLDFAVVAARHRLPFRRIGEAIRKAHGDNATTAAGC